MYRKHFILFCVAVPNILFSGDPKKIEKWRLEKSLEITKKKRPDLL